MNAPHRLSGRHPGVAAHRRAQRPSSGRPAIAAIASLHPVRDGARDIGAATAIPGDPVASCTACGGQPAGAAGNGTTDEGRSLVCRAVQSVLAGALNESNEQEFARTLGVSGRHLRRLFLKHLGVTPATMAASARVHVGRRLLTKTEMKVSDVAFVVGFGSVRQFNRAVVEAYGATPRALREGRPGQPLHACDSLTIRLSVPPRYDWEQVLALIDCAATPAVEWTGGDAYRRVIESASDELGVLEARRTPGADHLQVTLHLPAWAGILHVVDRVRTTLGVPPTASSRTEGPDAARAPGDRGGIPPRPVAEWSAFEGAVKAIVGLPDDQAGKDRLATLIQRFGEPVGVTPFERMRRFPAPHVLSRHAPGDLPFPEWISRPIGELASAIVEGSMPIAQDIPANVRFRSFRSLSGVSDQMAQRFMWLTGGPDCTYRIQCETRSAEAAAAPASSRFVNLSGYG